MSDLSQRLGNAWYSVTDPGRQSRIEHIVAVIEHAFKKDSAGFDRRTVLDNHEFLESDVRIAASTYYSRLLTKYWSNGLPDKQGKKVLNIVAEKLRLPRSEALRLTREIGLEYFGARVAFHLRDGMLTDIKMSELTKIANELELDVRSIFRQISSGHCLNLLSGLFAEATSTGKLDPKYWLSLAGTASKLGISGDELVRIVNPSAKTYAEQILANAREEGWISDNDGKYLAWLARTFLFEPSFVGYLRKHVVYLRERGEIARGNIGTLPIPSGANLKSGELLYFCHESILRFPTIKKGKSAYRDHHGRLLLTDNRLIFSSASKSISVSYRSIIHWNGVSDRIDVQARGKPQIAFYIRPGSAPLFVEKFSSLLRMSNQTLVREVEGMYDRYIPREVRQRVFQICGGKCVDCGARHDLQFDHIIPKAKGGSNAEGNIQLLCGPCNRKKTDNI